MASDTIYIEPWKNQADVCTCVVYMSVLLYPCCILNNNRNHVCMPCVVDNMIILPPVIKIAVTENFPATQLSDIMNMSRVDGKCILTDVKH